MSDLDQLKNLEKKPLDEIESSEPSIAKPREWTGSFFWPVYRDMEAAKKHTRTAALVVFLFVLTMTYISLLSTRGELTGFGLSLTAIYLMSAVGIYFFYLPAAYFGAVIFIITTLGGLVYRLATVGFTQLSWLALLNTLVFVIFFIRSISGVRQYKEFSKDGD
jgi:hypothetical protein